MYAIMPLFIGYIIYSLIYEEHKGWFSFALATQVGFIYIFGISIEFDHLFQIFYIRIHSNDTTTLY